MRYDTDAMIRRRTIAILAILAALPEFVDAAETTWSAPPGNSPESAWESSTTTWSKTARDSGSAPRAETGIASYQGHEMAGRVMANGHRYRPLAPTCASRTHPIGAILDVWLGGRRTRCWVTDSGPYARGRAIDLSEGGARDLGMTKRGVARVVIEVAMAPLEHERRGR